jgi:hypothetical protein
MMAAQAQARVAFFYFALLSSQSSFSALAE